MTNQEALAMGQALLEAAGVPDPRADAGWLLSHVTGKNHLLLRLDGMERLTAAQEEAFLRLLALRQRRVPLQHVLGNQPFLGLDYRTDSRALIPRPETELLAEMAIAHLRGMETPRPAALDVGTGTGCLAISMALQVPRAQVTAVDLSPAALSLARENAQRLGAKVDFRESDLFTALPGQRFHLIVSNPPYIPTGELPGLQPEVQQDPVLALDGGPDGLRIYRRLIPGAWAHLDSGGALLLEIGSDQGESVPGLMRGAGFEEVTLHEDHGGLPRMVSGRKAPV